ncbi:MAG: DUF1707 domain-containing protein [Solirubrobacteraceae bacterium]
MTYESGWSGMGERRQDPNVRAGDADREAIADILRRQHTEGRLDADEFQERIDRCYRAKSLGELDGLLADLPREPQFSGRRRGRGRAWGFGSRLLRLKLVGFVPVLLVLAGLSALTGHHLFWVAIPLFFLAMRFGPWRRHRGFCSPRRTQYDGGGRGRWL